MIPRITKEYFFAMNLIRNFINLERAQFLDGAAHVSDNVFSFTLSCAI